MMHRACNDKIEYIDLLIDGGLSKKETSVIEAHLEDCPGCRIYYNDMKSLKSALASMELKVPDGLRENIMAEVRKIPVTNTRRRWTRPAYIAAYAAAACLVLAFSLFMFSNGLSMGRRNESAEMEESADGWFSTKSTDDERLAAQQPEMTAAPTMAPMPEPENDTAALEYNGYGITAEILGGEGYMFSTSPFKGTDNSIVNEGGISITDDLGISGTADMVLVTTGYTTDEITEILFYEFGLRTELTEEGFVKGTIPADMIGAVTARIDLVAAKAVENDSKSYEVLIIQISN